MPPDRDLQQDEREGHGGDKGSERVSHASKRAEGNALDAAFSNAPVQAPGQAQQDQGEDAIGQRRGGGDAHGRGQAGDDHRGEGKDAAMGEIDLTRDGIGEREAGGVRGRRRRRL